MIREEGKVSYEKEQGKEIAEIELMKTRSKHDHGEYKGDELLMTDVDGRMSTLCT